jgi:hypothetical protein
MKAANLMLAFLLELCALAALGYWGFHTGMGIGKFILAVGAPVVFAIIWAIAIAPKSVLRLPGPLSFILGVALLLLTDGLLAAAGAAVLAVAFAIVILLNAALRYIWHQ